MKLTKTQVAAIAEKVVEDVKAIHAEFNNEVLKKEKKVVEKFFKAFPAVKDYILYNQSGDSTEVYINKAITQYVKSVRPEAFKDIPEQKATKGYYFKETVEREIILSTIEETDLDSVIKKLVAKFTE